MALTRQRIRFADLVAMGFTQTDAYRKAFKGCADSTALVEASELMKLPEIQERIAGYDARFKANIEAAAEFASRKILPWMKENGRDRSSLARLAADMAGKNKKQLELSGPDGAPLEIANLSDADLERLQAEIDALKKKAD